jgi:hypothetical protein
LAQSRWRELIAWLWCCGLQFAQLLLDMVLLLLDVGLCVDETLDGCFEGADAGGEGAEGGIG